MKFISITLLSTLLASQALAGFLRQANVGQDAPKPNQTQSKSSSKGVSPAKGNTIGAAYCLSPTNLIGNFLVSAKIGQLASTFAASTLRRAVDTGDLGAPGTVSLNGPDPPFSLGSSTASNIVATVNASFLIGIIPADDKPASSGREFPAINSVGNAVYALNGGEINGIGRFKIDQKNNLKQTTPATGPFDTATQMKTMQFIASVEGAENSNPGSLAVFDVAMGSSLSPNFQKVQPSRNASALFALNVIKGKKALLATDPAIGFDIFAFSSGSNNTTNGKNATGNVAVAQGSSAVAIDRQVVTAHSSFSNKNGDFFLTDIAASTLTGVNMDDKLQDKVVNVVTAFICNEVGMPLTFPCCL